MNAAGATARTGAGLRVLVVCTGNVCRSPAAELLLRSRLGRTAGLEVVSAGLDALSGDPVAEPMARLLHAAGIDPAGFTARQLEPSGIQAADLVLTMTADQRRAVVTTVPGAVRRTFTLLEFAAIAELAAVPAGTVLATDRVAAVLAAAPQARARRQPSAEDDVADPYRRPDEVYARVFAVIDDAVARLVSVLRGPNALPTLLAQRDEKAVLAGVTRSGGDTQ